MWTSISPLTCNGMPLSIDRIAKTVPTEVSTILRTSGYRVHITKCGNYRLFYESWGNSRYIGWYRNTSALGEIEEVKSFNASMLQMLGVLCIRSVLIRIAFKKLTE